MPAFAKPGLIPRNPPVQVGEGTCQVQRRQPVLIRYQIREVSGSRRTGTTLLFLADPKSLPTNSSPETQPPPAPSLILLPLLTALTTPFSPPASAATHSKTISTVNVSQPVTWPRLLWQLALPLISCQQWRLWIRSRVSNLCGEPWKKRTRFQFLNITECKSMFHLPSAWLTSNIFKPQFSQWAAQLHFDTTGGCANKQSALITLTYWWHRHCLYLFFVVLFFLIKVMLPL